MRFLYGILFAVVAIGTLADAANHHWIHGLIGLAFMVCTAALGLAPSKPTP
jgi:hypothetical protein